MRSNFLFWILIFCIFVFPLSSPAKVVDGWLIDRTSASDPLTFTHNGKTLNILKGLGPVFVTGKPEAGPEACIKDEKLPDQIVVARRGEVFLGPDRYAARVISVEEKAGTTILNCRATGKDFTGLYTLRFRKLADGAMELVVEGNKNVRAFLCGNIQGSNGPFKQVYLGQRDMESHISNDGWAPLLYWPEGKLFLYTEPDLDFGNCATIDHRLMPRKNFLAADPPASCDLVYGVLTDGTRPALRDRYVLRAATDPWEAYGPVPNKPSEYAKELSEMIFNDLWDDGFAPQTSFLQWLKDPTAGLVRFYTILEVWSCTGTDFDVANPDVYRVPDHAEPLPRLGTKDDLKQLVDTANSIGRSGLRTLVAEAREGSYSIREGIVRRAKHGDGRDKSWNDFSSLLPFIRRQDGEFHRDFGTTACFSDCLGSGGFGFWGFVNFDASRPGAGTVAAARRYVREFCRTMKDIHGGPMGSESVISDYLIGDGLDTGDFCIFGGDRRYDFTPEYKLRRFHPLTTLHSMGLGYRYFFRPDEKDWMPRGCRYYFNDDEKLDSYRAAEILYGNGGYLFFYSNLRKVHALTECFTVGVAQRHYALQEVDFVKYGQGTTWKTITELLTDPQIDSPEKLQAWFKRFHVRYANGCHVYVNRDAEPQIVRTEKSGTHKLPQNGWLVCTEDGNLTAYTALIADPVRPRHEGRVDFCQDKVRKIKYVNPRKLTRYLEVSQPTVWLDGKVHFVLKDPQTTFGQDYQRKIEATYLGPLIEEDFEKNPVDGTPKGWRIDLGSTVVRTVKDDQGGQCLNLIDEPNSPSWLPAVLIPFMQNSKQVTVGVTPVTVEMKVKIPTGCDGFRVFLENRMLKVSDTFTSGSGVEVRQGKLWTFNTDTPPQAIAPLIPDRWFNFRIVAPDAQSSDRSWQVVVKQDGKESVYKLTGFKPVAASLLMIQKDGKDGSQCWVDDVKVVLRR